MIAAVYGMVAVVCDVVTAVFHTVAAVLIIMQELMDSSIHTE
jgi:hypothetical protein